MNATPTRSSAELLSAAMKAGWHHNELGREILAELTRRYAPSKRLTVAIWGLAVALVLAVIGLGALYAQNQRLTEVAAVGSKSGALADENAKRGIASAEAVAAAERQRAIDATENAKALKAAIEGQQAAVVKQFTEQLSSAREENSRLRDEVAFWKAKAPK